MALWREQAEKDIKTGDYVVLKNVIRATHNKEPILSTTYRSDIQKEEQPEAEKTVEIIALEAKEGTVWCLLTQSGDDVLDLKVEEDVLVKALLLNKDHTEEEFVNMLPLKVTATIKRNFIINLK